MKHCDLEDVVISGIGCKLPESESMEEFAEKLFSGQSMVTRDDRKLSQGLFENLPEFSGKIRHTRKFDLTFFGISNFVGQCMDPMTQQILERTFEAVMDAGINPCELRGSNTVVYSGTSISDFDLEWAINYKGGYGIMGRNRCMNANRVSYWLDLKGTSVSLDSTWANGLSNLVNGWDSVRRGRCDAAIVSAANLQASAEVAIQLNDLGQLSPSGMCRSFDDSADGYARSDAVVVFVLQRASMAKRSYATIAHVVARNFGDRSNVIHKPLRERWESIFQECYTQSRINPNDICYIEGHGSGVKDEDQAEMSAIANFFCHDRKSPLLVGSVKSNMGHAESASASCGLLKALICLQHSFIPQNINFTTPSSGGHGLNGKLKLVEKNTPLPQPGFVAVNAHGFGGVYAHLILKPNDRRKVFAYDGIPRLVLIAGRTAGFLDTIFQKIESMPFDPDYVSLLNEINSNKVDKYLGRGYTILPKQEGSSIHEHQVYHETKRPVWFIFSGMGSQWPQMGKRLMDLPMFRESIEKCHKILEAKDLNLRKIITGDDPTTFDNILHSFVGIAAIQIALVDVLHALGIVPDGVIGHSVGELGCAYADGCFTAEQMILSAYSRGRASLESNLIPGFMAAIGKGYAQIKDELPNGIEVACRNSADSCTISGPKDMIQTYVMQLESRGIFAKTVNVSNIAYHSRYIKPAAPRLLKYLKEVIPEPKIRSSKWISTSNPVDDWNTDLAKYCSAEYHTNNLLSPVLFEDGCKHIPKNAICIEIAPHGLLQPILKRSLGESTTNIPLTRRAVEDPLIFLLQAIGKLYIAGLEPQVINLYPRVEYPVSSDTPSIHQLIQWNHEADITTAQTRAEKKVIYSVKSHFYKTATDGTGYIINGENTYPVSVFLHLVWGIFASFNKRKIEDCPIKFQDVRVEDPMAIHPSKNDEGIITVQKGTGDFEINTMRLVVKGNISMVHESDGSMYQEVYSTPDSSYLTMTQDEIYSEILKRDVVVGDSLKPLQFIHIGSKGWKAEICPNMNWIQVMEALFQIQILKVGEENDATLFPRTIEKLIIIPKHFLNSLTSGDNTCINMNFDFIQNIINCQGLEMKGCTVQELPPFSRTLKFTSQRFTHFSNPPLKDVWQCLDFCFGIIIDNICATEVNMLQVGSGKNVTSFTNYIMHKFSYMKLKFKVVSEVQNAESKQRFDLVIGSSPDAVECKDLMKEQGFILLTSDGNKEERIPSGLALVSKYSADDQHEVLLLKKSMPFNLEPEFIRVYRNESLMLDKLRRLEPHGDRPVYLVSYEQPDSEMENFKRRFRTATSIPLRWIFVFGRNRETFDPEEISHRNHLLLGLHTNVFCDGAWGSFLRYSYDCEQLHCHPINVNKMAKELRDVHLGFDTYHQLDYSGRFRGDNGIMGVGFIADDKSILRDKYLSWNVPKSWNLEDAATVPISYVLAYYCITLAGKLKGHESLLITDACTPFGIASIQVGLSVVPRVFATVKDDAEGNLIRKRFPMLPQCNVVSHGNKNFHVLLGIITKGKYPDMIISSLTGERLMATINCLPAYGRIFHFGDEDYKKNVPLGMSVFLAGNSFHSVSHETISNMSENDKQLMHQLIQMGIRDGVVTPLPRKPFSLAELQKLLREPDGTLLRGYKAVLRADASDSIQRGILVDSDSSYLIFGDETEIWVDILLHLIRKGARNIVISQPGNTRRAERYATVIGKRNVVLREERNMPDVKSLLAEAGHMGHLMAVFVIVRKSPYGLSIVEHVDAMYRDGRGSLSVISKDGAANEICSRRNVCGFPSTNFIWDSQVEFLSREMDLLDNLCGKESVFFVSRELKGAFQADSVELMLKDTLPATAQHLCSIGAHLSKEVVVKELPSQRGLNNTTNKELSPLFFICGLTMDPELMLLPLAREMMYSTFYIRLPHLELPVKKLVPLILRKIMEVNENSFVFNIIGVSWGCFVAIETAKQIEEMGGTVSLILIDCPHRNLKQSLMDDKSWESHAFDLIASILSPAEKIKMTAGASWAANANYLVESLKLNEETEKNMREAIDFILNKLLNFFNHDIDDITLFGPLTVVRSGYQPTDDRAISKMSNSISVHHLPVKSTEILASKELREIILGSAITESMSKNTIHQCSWRDMEDFLSQQKLGDSNALEFDSTVTVAKLKFSFAH